MATPKLLHDYYVSIHAPWEGCDAGLTTQRQRYTVSIHAPWEGCDTTYEIARCTDIRVSIHAPWEGCDCQTVLALGVMVCFNSRTLGRVRPNSIRHSLTIFRFQFTHPGKGATTTAQTFYD